MQTVFYPRFGAFWKLKHFILKPETICFNSYSFIRKLITFCKTQQPIHYEKVFFFYGARCFIVGVRTIPGSCGC